jgi:hypothetical protein
VSLSNCERDRAEGNGQKSKVTHSIGKSNLLLATRYLRRGFGGLPSNGGFLRIQSAVLLATCYSLLATCYLLLATRYLLLATRYSLLATRHTYPHAFCPLPNALKINLNRSQRRGYWKIPAWHIYLKYLWYNEV